MPQTSKRTPNTIKATEYGALMDQLRRAINVAALAADTDGDTPTYRTQDMPPCTGVIGDDDNDGDIDICIDDLWPRYFYADCVIVAYGPALYRVGYTIVDGLPVVDSPDMWVMVEMAFEPVGEAETDDAAESATEDAADVVNGVLVDPAETKSKRPTFMGELPRVKPEPPAEQPAPSVDDLVTEGGGAIKSVDGAPKGTVGGYLVYFGGQGDLSPMRDVFTKNTDFGGAAESLVWVHHRGLPEFKQQLANKAKLTVDKVGVFATHLLDMRNEYEAALYELASAGKLGWSSGTAPHLVERKSLKGGLHEITQWPLGLDASYTPTPAGGFDTNVAVKALSDFRASLLATSLAGKAESSTAETKGAQAQDSGRATALAIELELLDIETP
jgi:hypothetical protein